VVVRCTKTMLDLLGREVTLSEPAPSDDDWYLNVLWIDRQKGLLLTHCGTLFSVFRAGVSRSTLGYMKEMAFELGWNIADDGGLDRIDIDELNHALRRQLRSRCRDYARRIELVNERLANQHRPAHA
jgi:hypothetical protein